jgi:CTP:molybdopterin cytidylyltransferase MocA
VIAGLVLAAGESSRMGRAKALLTYRGQTFLETSVAALRASGITRIAVVLGHHAEEIERALDLQGIEVVINRDYRRGQSSSLLSGLSALTAPELEAIVLCLVDYPAVSPATVRALVGHFEKTRAPVVIPTFQGQRGHPVVIGRALFDELARLSPEEGANAVIRKHRPETHCVEVEDRGILLDIDDAESYQRLPP